MTIRLATLHLGALATLAAFHASAAPRITVDFIDPAQYTDAYPSGRRSGTARELQHTLDTLREAIVAAGTKTLADGDELKMEVLDVNLAGEYDPPMGGPRHEVRVLRDIDWPSLKIRYTLQRAGKTSQGETTISDMSYLMNASQCRGSETFCYERRMVERWFRKDLR